MQTAAAFGQVQHSLSFMISSYTDVAAWRSVVERLAGFERALKVVRVQMAVIVGIRHTYQDSASLIMQGVELDLLNSQPLVANVNFTVRRGDSVLLCGPSGAGKSTLLRSLAGLWPFGSRQISMRFNPRILFLPQKPYLPIGTLREVVSYPMPAGCVDDATLRETLEAVGLQHLAGKLDEDGHWAIQLSPGEQQRIAFAAHSYRRSSGCSWMKQARQSTRQRKPAYIGWCVIGFRGRPCSASDVDRRYGLFTPGTYLCRWMGAGLRPLWKLPLRMTGMPGPDEQAFDE
jgi:ABC-type uncharacterized transport system fused permease/ATPase subunit